MGNIFLIFFSVNLGCDKKSELLKVRLMVQEPFSRTCSIDKIKSAQKGHCTSGEPGETDIAETVSQSRVMKMEGEENKGERKEMEGEKRFSLLPKNPLYFS